MAPIKVLVAQCGGSSPVLNQTLAGAVLEAKKQGLKVFGAREGFRGMVERDFVDFHPISESNLFAIAKTQGAILGGSNNFHIDVTGDYSQRDNNMLSLVSSLKKEDIHILILFGGDSSAGIGMEILNAAKHIRHELTIIHAPKTIDNDLWLTDHTPGYGSAAKFVANASAGMDADNSTCLGVMINITMGRGSGFLAAAAALARNRTDILPMIGGAAGHIGPHKIYLPEKEYTLDSIMKDAEFFMKEFGRAHLVFSEAIGPKVVDPETCVRFYKAEQHLKDEINFTHGSHMFAEYLKDMMIQAVTKNVRANAFNYACRATPQAKVDAQEAFGIGKFAAQHCQDGKSGSAIMVRNPGSLYSVHYKFVDLELLVSEHKAKGARKMPIEFLSTSNGSPLYDDVSPAFLKYVLPLTK
ncbi:MAG: 6-phosphofructokinase [Candidatus Micrarchaeota archaeon]|nr:6-phosphofructokinase [Candidatus Micrarchaeota archaeon]